MTPERLNEIQTRAYNADHAWPSNHAAYMPEPCAEILTDWLYPLAEGALELLAELARLQVERDLALHRAADEEDKLARVQAELAEARKALADCPCNCQWINDERAYHCNRCRAHDALAGEGANRT